MQYEDFIASKFDAAQTSGFVCKPENRHMFGFQRAIVEWALSIGRGAIFADTGLGKTLMQLVWADEVCKHTGGRVLIMAPLAVAHQTAAEAVKFDVAGVGVHGEGNRIDIINYESMHKIDCSVYSGVVLDESSILKNAQGRMRNRIIDTFKATPYKLACTATPAPNDYTELGNHSEFLGVMPEAIMRARWFINDMSVTVNPWRLKKHAIKDFWRWVSTWSRCVGMPSDVGDYDDSAYVLPELHTVNHVIAVDITKGAQNGMLFRVPDISATGIHNEKRRTLADRVAELRRIVDAIGDDHIIIWCETNYEQDAVMAEIPECIDVRGNMKPEEKARKLIEFTDRGGIIVTKPSIAGMGLNWQHCCQMVFVGGSYSYERFYQAVRRSWRFGQTREVHAHTIMASTETGIWAAIGRKSDNHDAMKSEMYDASRKAARAYTSRTDYHPIHTASIPAWLHTSTEAQ